MGSCYSSKTHMHSSLSPRNNEKTNIICTLWIKESHGLFDYESKNIRRIPLKINSPCSLVKSQKIVSHTNDQKELDILPPESKILEISYLHNNDIALYYHKHEFPANNHDGSSSQSIWHVVKSNKDPQQKILGYKLSQGDVIKLGRMRLKVKSLKGIDTISPVHNSIPQINQDSPGQRETFENEQFSQNNLNSFNLSLACRICLEKNDSENDPFISPCKCAGTMKIIHVKCLQKWLMSKNVIKQSNISTTILFKTLACELCKTIFPEFLDGPNGKKFPSFEVDMPKENFIVLEILNTNNKNVPKGILIVDMKTKKNIRIGRANDSDLKFSDISVSRTHAIINFTEGEFYLKDNDSKFGTLILIKKPIPLKYMEGSTIQISSTTINFHSLIFPNSNEKKGKTIKNPKIEEIISQGGILEKSNNSLENIINQENIENGHDNENINNNNDIVFNLENDVEVEESVNGELPIENIMEGDRNELPPNY